MATNSFEIKGGEQFAKIAAGLTEIELNERTLALKSTLDKGKRKLRDIIERSNAVASGTGLRSVTSKINSLSNELSGEIFFKSPADRYMFYADKGRGPGKPPPLQRIIEWVRLKGIDEKWAYPIARQLGKSGTDVKAWILYDRTPFMDEAVAAIDEIAKQEFEKAAERIARRVEANANNRTSTS